MNIFEQVLERDNYKCIICGARDIEVHHILGGTGRRKQQQRIETMVCLCAEHHRGTNGVHGMNGKKLDNKLKMKLQRSYFKEGYSIDETRNLMGGKLYLDKEGNL